MSKTTIGDCQELKPVNFGAAAIDIIEAPEQHLAMSAAARAMGRPGSADAVAELLLALAERRALPDPGEVARIAAGPMRAAT